MPYQDENFINYEPSNKRLIIAAVAFFAILVCIFATTFIFLSIPILKKEINDKNRNIEDSILNSGIVLYYSFNNEEQYGETGSLVHDFSGNGNDGIVNGAVWNSTGGKSGDGAFEFGSGDNIKTADSDALSPSSFGQYFTISFWIRFDETVFAIEGLDKDYTNYLEKGSSDEGYEWSFRKYNSSNLNGRNDRISFYTFNPRGGLGAGSYFQDDIKKGEWVYITGVINGTHTKIYKNGVLRGVNPLSEYNISMKNGGADLYIGKTRENNYFRGSIDELRIYNRALNDSQVQELYDFSMEGHK